MCFVNFRKRQKSFPKHVIPNPTKKTKKSESNTENTVSC